MNIRKCSEILHFVQDDKRRALPRHSRCSSSHKKRDEDVFASSGWQRRRGLLSSQRWLILAPFGSVLPFGKKNPKIRKNLRGQCCLLSLTSKDPAGRMGDDGTRD